MHANDRDLARRLEDAERESTRDYAQTQARLRPDLNCAVETIGDGLAVFVGPTSPINRVYGLAMHAPANADMLNAAEAFYAKHGDRPRLDLCPLADDSLTPLLLRRGYGVLNFRQIWWRSLAGDENSISAPLTSSHLRLELISPDQRLLWAQTVSAGFSGAAPLAAADVEIPLANAYKDATSCFLAWVGDTPAGGGAVAIHHGVAICYSTATRPAFRRLGIQRALLEARLRFAIEQGCDLAAVATTPGSASQRNVERLDFHLAYTKPTVEKISYTTA